MKNTLALILLIFGITLTTAQTEKKKDTLKTEVVNVVSSYAPTIADATKIKQRPTVSILKQSQKKKMTYTIFSAPVASTFVPKPGALKEITIKSKPEAYQNYAALGFGNYTTPFAELSLHKSHGTKKTYGMYAKYISSENSISDTPLNSYFSNFESKFFYSKKENNKDWKITFNTAQNNYNWYGLPNTVNLTNAINTINEEQRFNLFEVIGDLSFNKASLFNQNKLEISLYTDAFKSKEWYTQLSTTLAVPLDFIHPAAKNLNVKTNLEFLGGEFNQNYQGLTPENYSILTLGIQPEYQFVLGDLALKTGIKLYTSIDTENSINNFLLYPNLALNTPILEDYISLYASISGGLTTNTYKDFSGTNPFVSPTLFITQTSEKYNYTLGFNGKITNQINFNIKGSYRFEEDKPLFINNNSKYNGTNFANLKGYEYGNSFSVRYDDVKTVSIFGEIAYDFSEDIAVGIKGQFDQFTPTNELEVWNLPNITTTVFGKYQQEKWYVTTSIFYVGERKEVSYSGAYPSSFAAPQAVGDYLDFNINGGYSFSPKFSTFLKLNNILNSDYQQFNNFTVQGFQILAGLSYQFNF